MSIPDTLRATVLRRLQCLERAERIVILRASVIGRDFDLSTLVATASDPESSVRAALDRARDLQLVEAHGGDRYSFRHALTREILYCEFLDARTRPLHRRITRELERAARAGKMALAELAYHAWAAGDSGRARQYNELAGDNAAAMHAYDDARRYYLRARSLIAMHSPEYARLTRKLVAVGETG
jgi:predicted ATPase